MTVADQALSMIRAHAQASPIAAWLGFSVTNEEESFLYGLAFAERHIGNALIRALHGGGIAAFLEFSAQCELAAKLGRAEGLRTLNTDIDYISSSRAQDMKARVSILRLGRRIAFVEATGWQDDETHPVAKARFRIRIAPGKIPEK